MRNMSQREVTELFNRTDMEQVPKYERFRIDGRTIIDNPIEVLSPLPGDNVEFKIVESWPGDPRIVEAVVVRGRPLPDDREIPIR